MKRNLETRQVIIADNKAGVPLLPTLFLGFLLLLAVPFPALALSPHLAISEFIVDVSGPESDSEMIELYNPTGMVLDIGGWDLAYKSATGSSWSAISTIPAGETIPAYGYYLIGGDKIAPPADWVDTSLGMASAGGHIALRNSSNVIIDKVGYGTANDPEGGAAPPAPGTDDSLERLPGCDENNMLTSVATETQNVNVRYLYIPDGRQVRQTANGNVTNYFHDEYNPLAEYDSASQREVRYTYNLIIDDIVSAKRGDSTEWYHKDALGSVMVLTDASETTTDRYRYDPFGGIVWRTGSTDNDVTYTGRRIDMESGLHYYRARYYNSEIGVFCQRDDDAEMDFYNPMTMNLYMR